MLRRRDLFPRCAPPRAPPNKSHFYREISGPLCQLWLALGALFPPVFSVFLRQMLALSYQAIQLGSIRELFLPELCALNCGLRTKNDPSLPSPSFISPPSSRRPPHPLSAHWTKTINCQHS